MTIDGFNLIISIEVALSGSVLILGNDGVLRDLAGLRGNCKSWFNLSRKIVEDYIKNAWIVSFNNSD